MILELVNSLETLFSKSDVPHFVQMHAGTIDQAAIDRWAASNSLVKKQQTVEMINIEAPNILLGGSALGGSSVMDNSFVKQNTQFDFLLDLDNERIQVAKGNIAVPIHYMQQANLKIGDTVRVAGQSFSQEFTISDFVRDAQMNPSIISSKRFVVHATDFDMLKYNLGETEYLIEFQLKDLANIQAFHNAYSDSDLPKKGPAVDYALFRSLNAMTDGIIAAVVILVSLLINVVAMLCLGFTILATIEEDYREIGVMKAIGIPQHEIKKIYLSKYVVMAALACTAGYAASLFLNPLFTANIMLYIGRAPKTFLQSIVPVLPAGVVFLIVVSFCALMLRRFNRISAVEALRSESPGGTLPRKNFWPLHQSKFSNVNIFLGLRDVFQRFQMFRLLFAVFIVCTFIIIIPVNSPSFSAYMGIGQSDIRIDLRQSEDVAQRFEQLITYIKNDPDVERFSPLVTSQLKVINPEGIEENLNVETGDFRVFPLQYLKGGAPLNDNEIALSYLNSDEMKKDVGDTIRLVVNGQPREMVVSGVYQDVTNGGRSAKASLPYNPETVLWYVVTVDVRENISQKMAEYSQAFSPAKVTHLEGYMTQTFGNTIDQLTRITALALVVAVFVSILITSLFMKMLIAKDTPQIAILKSLGVSLQDARVQYLTRALVVLNLGIILGTIMANTIGQYLVSAIWAQMGASNIQFVINPLQAYLLYPLGLILVVSITTVLSTISIQETSITRLVAE
jgi:putative ABC transport system permease protein